MRRKISLYIGDLLADLDDQSLVLLTYTAEDTKNPATVLNSYSRQLVLPGTGRNAAIFGHYGRVDRAIDRGSAYATGTGYTPTQRTAFAIYDERGEILEAGYVRLDRVAKSGGIVRGYHVTLFGGLGSFFALLSYRPDGTALTLADLNYITNQQETDASVRPEGGGQGLQRIASFSVGKLQTAQIRCLHVPSFEGNGRLGILKVQVSLIELVAVQCYGQHFFLPFFFLKTLLSPSPDLLTISFHLFDR